MRDTNQDENSLTEVRVLAILSAIPLYGNELTNISIMQVLRSAGAEVKFITNADWGHKRIEPYLCNLGFDFAHLVFFGKPDRRVRWPRLFTWFYLQVRENFKLWRILREFKPTHIHLNNLWDVYNLWPILNFYGAKIIFNAGVIPDTQSSLHRYLWRVLVINPAYRVVANSAYTLKHFAVLNLSPRKAGFIHNAPPKTIQNPQSNYAKLNLVKVTFLFVGQISKHKGAHFFVEAALKLISSRNDCNFVLVGDGDPAFVAHLHSQVGTSKAQDAIKFVGYQADVSPWYVDCALHVAPSMCFESFGNVVAEAKYAGRASIVFADGALPDLVQDQRNGWVCKSSSVEALIEAMRFYLEHPKQIQLQGENALASVKELALDQFGAKWIEVYAS